MALAAVRHFLRPSGSFRWLSADLLNASVDESIYMAAFRDCIAPTKVTAKEKLVRCSRNINHTKSSWSLAYKQLLFAWAGGAKFTSKRKWKQVQERGWKIEKWKRGERKTKYLDGVVASNNAAILDFDISCRVGKLALCIGASAFVALKLATDFKLKPARVLNIKQGINNCHDINRWDWQQCTGEEEERLRETVCKSKSRAKRVMR